MSVATVATQWRHEWRHIFVQYFIYLDLLSPLSPHNYPVIKGTRKKHTHTFSLTFSSVCVFFSIVLAVTIGGDSGDSGDRRLNLLFLLTFGVATGVATGGGKKWRQTGE
jgi:hypothetical protein